MCFNRRWFQCFIVSHWENLLNAYWKCWFDFAPFHETSSRTTAESTKQSHTGLVFYVGWCIFSWINWAVEKPLLVKKNVWNIPWLRIAFRFTNNPLCLMFIDISCFGHNDSVLFIDLVTWKTLFPSSDPSPRRFSALWILLNWPWGWTFLVRSFNHS